MEERETILKYWKKDGQAVLDAIDAQVKVKMTLKEFLSHCVAMGGDWGLMLLTGIDKLYPDVWIAIPDDMGCFAWICLQCVLRLLGVYSE